MKLSFSQIEALTKGAVRITKEPDGIHFQRYTDAQITAFEKEARCFFKRAQHTCGIRIEFYTDSSDLTVCVGAEGKYEVLVDDITAFCREFSGADRFVLSLGTGAHRITIVLPSHSPGVIRSVEVADGASVSPVEYRRKIVFYGDSITQGWNSGKDSRSYAWLVTRHYDADSMILGVGGVNFYPDTVDRNGFDADIVIVALGTNDYSGDFTADQIRSGCAEYLKRLSAIYKHSKMFYVTPIWRADGADIYAAGTHMDVCRVIAEEAELQGFTVIDGYSLVPHEAALFADGFLHPNDEGFSHYARNLIAALNAYL